MEHEITIQKGSGPEEAERRIDACLRHQNTELELSGMGLEEIPYRISELRHLEKLRLNFNQIQEIKNLENLQNLETLELYSNQIRVIQGLERLSNLQNLYLSLNKIREIQGLDMLGELHSLDLGYNQIQEMQNLEKLSKLLSLDLDNNQIQEIRGLEQQGGLTYLNVSDNQIQNFQGLEKLNNIYSLNLSSNQIQDIRGLEPLSKLQYLDLSSNQIQDIRDLEPLSKLQYLDLSSNPIQEIKESSNLLKLLENELPKLENLRISSCPFLESMSEFKPVDYRDDFSFNHLEVFKRDLRKLAKKDTPAEVGRRRSTLPHKVIIIGNSSSGKSSLMDFITQEKLIDPNAEGESTDVLHIVKWEHKDSHQEVFFYDLGGQDYYHASYNLFLSLDATYLLVWSRDKNRNRVNTKDSVRKQDYYTFDTSYWLGNIDYKLREAGDVADAHEHVLLVETKTDIPFDEEYPLRLAADALDMKRHELSLSSKASEPLHRAQRELFLQHFLQKIGNEEEDYEDVITATEDYIRFWEKTKKKRYKYTLSGVKRQLKKQYDSWKSMPEGEDELLLRRFHRSGMLLWYEHIPSLKDTVFIDPQKVQADIIEFLEEIDKVSTAQKGCIAVKNACFKNERFDELKDLLLYQQIIFLDESYGKEHADYYIIPQKLPVTPKGDPLLKIATQGQGLCLSMLFSRYMPMGIMNRLICSFGKQPDVKKYFRYQMVFTLHGKTTVWMKCNMEQLRIDFHIAESERNDNVMRQLFSVVVNAYHGHKHITFDPEDDTPESLSREKEYYFREARKAMKRGQKMNLIKDMSSEGYRLETHPLSEFPQADDIPLDLFISRDGKYYINQLELEKQISEGRKRVESMHISSIIPDRIYEATAEDNTKLKKEEYVHEYRAFVKQRILKPKNVFISYAHDDILFKHELQSFLTNLEREGMIKIWEDGQLRPGEMWDIGIKEALSKADIVIMLISQSYIASNYIHEVELKKTLEGYYNGVKKFLPVLLKDCDWQHWNAFPDELLNNVPQMIKSLSTEESVDKGKMSNFQFCPMDDDLRLRPVQRFKHSEEAWVKVIKALRSVL